jgi:hypothetical protein
MRSTGISYLCAEGLHTSNHGALIPDLGTKDFQKSFTDFGCENSPILLLDRWRFRRLESAHVVEIDHGVVGVRDVD